MINPTILIVYSLLVVNTIPITISILLKKKNLVYTLCLVELLLSVILIFLSKQVIF